MLHVQLAASPALKLGARLAKRHAAKCTARRTVLHGVAAKQAWVVVVALIEQEQTLSVTKTPSQARLLGFSGSADPSRLRLPRRSLCSETTPLTTADFLSKAGPQEILRGELIKRAFNSTL